MIAFFLENEGTHAVRIRGYVYVEVVANLSGDRLSRDTFEWLMESEKTCSTNCATNHASAARANNSRCYVCTDAFSTLTVSTQFEVG